MTSPEYHTLRPWPNLDEVREFGALMVPPVDHGVSLMLGRVVVFSAETENRVHELLSILSKRNETTLDWQRLSKFGKRLSRLEHEASLLRDLTPIATDLIKRTVEELRPLHQKRGNLVHGTLTFPANGITATGRHGTFTFDEAGLRDLALRFSRVLFALMNAFDPTRWADQRSSQEKQTLLDFQASNPRIAPMHPRPEPQPGSSQQILLSRMALRSQGES